MDGDTPEIIKRRTREMRTISLMIGIYCKGHGHTDRTYTSYAGEPLCKECAAIDEYATMRTQNCRMMNTKTTCKECPVHCYSKGMREKIREIMAYAGPRMIRSHPVSAMRHVYNKKIKKARK